jgi:hypothetical protein
MISLLYYITLSNREKHMAEEQDVSLASWEERFAAELVGAGCWCGLGES